MAKVVLFVFEGPKTEKKIHEIFENHYFSKEHASIKVAFGAEIYQLWSQMVGDEFLDVLEVLKERQIENQDEIANLSRNDVSEMYLFFDYDGHTSTASNDDLTKMLEYFDEETEAGKLYISYPMVEAVRHINSKVDYLDTVFNIYDGRSYKELVNHETEFMHLSRVEKAHLDHIVAENCKKANYIVDGDRALPTFNKVIEKLSQGQIFQAQLNKHILKSKQVSVLSAFPLFTVEYFGEPGLVALYESLNNQTAT